MARETAVAIWYRRLDPGCFTTPRRDDVTDGSPAMETGTGVRAATERPLYATNVSDHWPSLAEERRGWSVEPVADRP
jgi:hypothetical protein